MERWVKIKSFPMYSVSNLGEIRNDLTNRILAQKKRGNYYAVNLCDNGKVVTTSVHRIVAKEFIYNPDNKPQVNHKDGNKFNNNVDNLEWVTAKENTIHYHRELDDTHSREVSSAVNSKPIKCVETGVVYKSARSASKVLGCCPNALTNCLTGRSKTSMGCHWEYYKTKGEEE